jgi:AcrR family transcriptional regulator
MSRRRGVRGEGRARLIGAAADCYGRGGRGAMTLKQVCAQANTSVETMYHHFPGGLRDLEDALYLDALASYQRGLLSELRHHRSAEAGVKSTVMFHLEWLAGNAGLARYLFSFDASWMSSKNLEQLERMNVEFAREGETWREPHVSAGRIRPLSSMLYGSMVLGPAQQYGSEIIAKAASEDVAEAVRSAGPALAQAAWLAVRGEAS